MAPTIDGGDCVFVNRLAYINNNPERFDAIVFKSPDKENGRTVWLAKRIVGMPGDTLEIIDGITYINGEKTTEKYVNKQTGSYGPFYVPKAGEEIIYDRENDKVYCSDYIVGDKTFLEKYCEKKNDKYYVKEDCYFCLGDNRDSSYDSRFWENKYTVKSEIMGNLIFNLSKFSTDFN